MIQINHKEYSIKVKYLPTAALRYIIKDCKEAITSMPDNPKNGYYQDEINYCVMELKARESKPKIFRPTEGTQNKIFSILLMRRNSMITDLHMAKQTKTADASLIYYYQQEIDYINNIFDEINNQIGTKF